MTNMPVLDKGSAAQNILSTKGTKPAQPSGGGSFDAVLKQTTAMGKQDTTPMKQTETAKLRKRERRPKIPHRKRN